MVVVPSSHLSFALQELFIPIMCTLTLQLSSDESLYFHATAAFGPDIYDVTAPLLRVGCHLRCSYNYIIEQHEQYRASLLYLK